MGATHIFEVKVSHRTSGFGGALQKSPCKGGGGGGEESHVLSEEWPHQDETCLV